MQDIELSWAEKMMEKGAVKAKQETLLRLLTQKFGPLPEGIVSTVEAVESSEELDRCFERILTATSLEEMGLG